MNELAFATRLDQAASLVEGGQWAIAELASECEAADFPDWALRIGNHNLVRRSPSTIRDWRRVAELRSLFQVEGATFGLYRRCLPFLARLEPPDVRHMLETAVGDGSTAEALSKALYDLAGRPLVDPGAEWRKLAEHLQQESVEMMPEAARGHLVNAARELQRAAAALAEMPEIARVTEFGINAAFRA